MCKVNNKIWEFIVTGSMINHLDVQELSLFINSLEDSIEEVCHNYNVEPWEMMIDV